LPAKHDFMKPEYPNALRGMLATLKSRTGASLDDLVHLLPRSYRAMDVNPRYLVFTMLATLVRWGLVEAYVDGKFLTADEMYETDRSTWPDNAIFYVTKTTIEIEEALGLAFDAATTTILGDIDRNLQLDAFILMPFDPVMHPVYMKHIRPVTSEMGLRVARADDFFTTGSIMTDIWSAINRAEFIIADCTGRNPNVFYEIGLAHARAKDTILLTQTIDDVPFDLRHLRVIVYDLTPQGRWKLEENLMKTIATLRNSALPDSPEGARCPNCGGPLRTSMARQCRYCHSDWH
jgi:hypothetical protein